MRSLIGLAHGKGHASPNLIRNGSFVGHADGWYPHDSGVTVAYAAGESVTPGSGALSIDVDGVDVVSTASYRPGGLLIPYTPLARIDGWVSARSDADGWSARLEALFFSSPDGVDYDSPSIVDAMVSGTFSVTSSWNTVQLFDSFNGSLLAPESAYVLISVLQLGGAQSHPAFYDDIYFGVAGGAAPPYAGT